jgi:hypothetical protein
MRPVTVVSIAAAATLLIGCSGTHHATQPPATVLQGLRRANAEAVGRATSTDWVLSSADEAGVASQYSLGPHDPVYLFDEHGSFVWHHGCPWSPHPPPSACTNVGGHEIVALDAKGDVLVFGVEALGPNLARLGTVRTFKL